MVATAAHGRDLDLDRRRARNCRRRPECREAHMKSNNKLRTLLERISADDRPRIPEFDELLEALRLHHGPDGRPDLIPRTTTGTLR